jgi:hypothetical protein
LMRNHHTMQQPEIPMPVLAIHDGYTREALLSAGTTHPAFWVAYRPLLGSERRRLALQTVRLQRHGEPGRTAATHLVAAALAARLMSWELFDDRGELLPICADTLLQLEPDLFRQIQETVCRFDDEELSAKNCLRGCG